MNALHSGFFLFSFLELHNQEGVVAHGCFNVLYIQHSPSLLGHKRVTSETSRTIIDSRDRALQPPLWFFCFVCLFVLCLHSSLSHLSILNISLYIYKFRVKIDVHCKGCRGCRGCRGCLSGPGGPTDSDGDLSLALPSVWNAADSAIFTRVPKHFSVFAVFPAAPQSVQAFFLTTIG